MNSRSSAFATGLQVGIVAMLCVVSLFAQTPQRIPELTPEHRAALLHWVDEQERIEGSLKANLAAITLSAAATDSKLQSAQANVSALEGELSAQKRATFWAKCKYAVIGIVLGIVGAIASFILTRAGAWMLTKSAALGIRSLA